MHIVNNINNITKIRKKQQNTTKTPIKQCNINQSQLSYNGNSLRTKYILRNTTFFLISLKIFEKF